MNNDYKGEIIIYQTEDGLSKIDVKIENETVWLSLDQMADLFQIDKSTISRHIRNVFSDGELGKDSVVVNFATTASEYSTGHFPRGYTPGYFASGTQKPVMLNPRIVEVLFRTGRIESFGSVFERTFFECDSKGVDYAYNETKSGFEFIFFRPLGHKNV